MVIKSEVAIVWGVIAFVAVGWLALITGKNIAKLMNKDKDKKQEDDKDVGHDSSK